MSRIVAGFDADPLLAASAAALLRRTGSYQGTALSTRVVPLLPELDLLDLDDELRLLGWYAHDRLLAAPERRQDWESTRELLRGFGLYLTDSGIRAGRSPVDTITAASRAKDTAVVDILRHELDSIGDRLRAVVVTDAAEHSAPHRALDVLVPASRPGPAGGAVRCMSTLLSDADLRSLHPVLLTSSRLSLASGDTSLLDRLRRSTGLALPATDDGWMLSVTGQGVGSAGLVLAVSELVTAGEVRLVVGTRGLLGEGWDCPAVNTLIDLTAATTSASTQQLRGRTMRLDPGWVDKVAHNWSVTCLLPSHPRLRSNPDLNRLRRKAEHLWSLVRIDDPESAPVSASDESGGAPVVETGLDAMLSPVQRRLLERILMPSTPLPWQASIVRSSRGDGSLKHPQHTECHNAAVAACWRRSRSRAPRPCCAGDRPRPSGVQRLAPFSMLSCRDTTSLRTGTPLTGPAPTSWFARVPPIRSANLVRGC